MYRKNKNPFHRIGCSAGHSAARGGRRMTGLRHETAKCVRWRHCELATTTGKWELTLGWLKCRWTQPTDPTHGLTDTVDHWVYVEMLSKRIPPTQPPRPSAFLLA